MRIYEVESGTAFVLFAYANPPTKEYGEYFRQVKMDAGSNDYFIYLNPTQNNELNPLGFADLIKYNKMFYPSINFRRDKLKNQVEILRKLSKNYTNVVLYTTPELEQNNKKLESYAKSFGITTFTIRNIDNSSHGANQIARKAVIDNDFSLFCEQFETKNKHVLSQFFILLRKVMILSESSKSHVVEDYMDTVITNISSINGSINLLESYKKVDRLGNKYIDVNVNNIKLRLIENKDITKPLIGKCKLSKRTALFVKETTTEYLYINKDLINNLIETTVSGNVSSLVMPLGEPIRRVDTKDIDYDIEGANDLSSAITYFINKNGYIDNKVIERLKIKYGKV